MAKIREYKIKIPIDYKGFQEDVDRIKGSLYKLSSDEYIIRFQANGEEEIYDQMRKLADLHPELSVQFNYDLNKEMLKNALNELEKTELTLDTGKTQQKLISLSDEITDLGVKIKHSLNADEKNIFTEKQKQLAKEFINLYETINDNGFKAAKIQTELSKRTGEAWKSYYSNLTSIAGSQPEIIDNSEERIKQLKSNVENIKKILDMLKSQGAVELDEVAIKDETDRLQKKILSLTARIEQLSEALDNSYTAGEYNELSKELTKTQEDLEETIEKVRELNEELNKRQNDSDQNEILTNQLEESKQKLIEYQKELENLRDENSKLTVELEKLNNTSKQVGDSLVNGIGGSLSDLDKKINTVETLKKNFEDLLNLLNKNDGKLSLSEFIDSKEWIQAISYLKNLKDDDYLNMGMTNQDEIDEFKKRIKSIQLTIKKSLENINNLNADLSDNSLKEPLKKNMLKSIKEQEEIVRKSIQEIHDIISNVSSSFKNIGQNYGSIGNQEKQTNSQELENLLKIKEAIQEIVEEVGKKNDAFSEEESIVKEVVASELNELKSLQNALEEIVHSSIEGNINIDNIKQWGNTFLKTLNIIKEKINGIFGNPKSNLDRMIREWIASDADMVQYYGSEEKQRKDKKIHTLRDAIDKVVVPRERSAIIDRQGNILGDYAHGQTGSTGNAYSAIARYKGDKSKLINIHSHGSDEYVASSMNNKNDKILEGDLWAWYYQYTQGIADTALTIAHKDIELFDIKGFFDEYSKKYDFSNSKLTKGSFAERLNNEIEDQMSKIDRSSVMFEIFDSYFDVDNFKKYFSSFSYDEIKNKYKNFKNSFIEKSKSLNFESAFWEAINEFGNVNSNGIKNFNYNNKAYLKNALNIPNFDIFNDERSVLTLSYRKATAEAMKNLGFDWDKYMKYYSVEDFIAQNPLNIEGGSFSRILQDAGLDSFINRLDDLEERLKKIGIAFSGEDFKFSFSDDATKNIDRIIDKLQELFDLIKAIANVEVQTDFSKFKQAYFDYIDNGEITLLDGLRNEDQIISFFTDNEVGSYNADDDFFSKLVEKAKESNISLGDLVKTTYSSEFGEDFLKQIDISGILDQLNNSLKTFEIGKTPFSSMIEDLDQVKEKTEQIRVEIKNLFDSTNTFDISSLLINLENIQEEIRKTAEQLEGLGKIQITLTSLDEYVDKIKKFREVIESSVSDIGNIGNSYNTGLSDSLIDKESKIIKEKLSESINTVIDKISEKNEAFVNERAVVENSINSEIKSVTDLSDVIKGLTEYLNSNPIEIKFATNAEELIKELKPELRAKLDEIKSYNPNTSDAKKDRTFNQVVKKYDSYSKYIGSELFNKFSDLETQYNKLGVLIDEGKVGEARQALETLESEIQLYTKKSKEASAENKRNAKSYSELSKTLSDFISLQNKVNNKESLTASEKSAYNQYVSMWKDALAAKNEYAISDDGSQESIDNVKKAREKLLSNIGGGVQSVIRQALEDANKLTNDEDLLPNYKGSITKAIKELNVLHETGIQNINDFKKLATLVGRIQNISNISKTDQGKKGTSALGVLSSDIQEFIKQNENINESLLSPIKELFDVLNNKKQPNLKFVKDIEEQFENLKKPIQELNKIELEYQEFYLKYGNLEAFDKNGHENQFVNIHNLIDEGQIDKARTELALLAEQIEKTNNTLKEGTKNNNSAIQSYDKFGTTIKGFKTDYTDYVNNVLSGGEFTEKRIAHFEEQKKLLQEMFEMSSKYQINPDAFKESVSNAVAARQKTIKEFNDFIQISLNNVFEDLNIMMNSGSYSDSGKNLLNGYIESLEILRTNGIQTYKDLELLFNYLNDLKNFKIQTELGKDGIIAGNLLNGKDQAKELSGEISDFLLKHTNLNSDVYNPFLDMIENLMSEANPDLDFVTNIGKSFKTQVAEIENIDKAFLELDNTITKIRNSYDSFDRIFKIKGLDSEVAKAKDLFQTGNFEEAKNVISSIIEKLQLIPEEIEEGTKKNKDLISSEKELLKTLDTLVILYNKRDSGEELTDSESEALENLIQLWQKAINAKDEYQVSQIASDKSIVDAQKQQQLFIDLLNGKLSKDISSKIGYLNKVANNDAFSSGFRNEAASLSNALEELRASGTLTQETFEQLLELFGDFDNIKIRMNSDDVKAGSKAAAQLADQIRSYMKQFDGMGKDYQKQLQNMVSMLSDPEIIQSTVNNIGEAFSRLKVEIKDAGKEVPSFFTKIKRSAIAQSAQFIGMYFSLYDIIRYARQFATTVTEVDSALTELRKVSNATDDVLAQSFQDSAVTAKELGSNLTDVINSTADWARLGYDVDAAEQLARVTTLYQNVGDNLDQESASESLVSTLQGFQLDVSEAESVVDKFNEVANNYAIDTSGIGEALQRSAASFNEANTDLSESIALIAGTNEVIQDPESVGNMWKTVSMRIRGATTELEEAGEETDGMVESTSKLRDIIKGMTGFDILEEDGKTFKSLYDIVVNVGKAYQELDDIDQAALLEKLAGKNRSNALAAAFNNIDTIEKAYKSAEESAGSAQREQENYAKSVQFSLDRLSASAQKFAADFLSSDLVKGLVDIANGFVSGADYLIDSLGSIPSLLGAGGIGLLLKGTIFNSDFKVSSIFKQSQGFGQLSKVVSLVNSSGITPALNDVKNSLQGVSVEAITTNASILKMSPAFEATALAAKGLTAEQTVQALAMQGLSAETVKAAMINTEYSASEIEKAVASTTFITATEAETIAVATLGNATTLALAKIKVFFMTLATNPIFQGLALVAGIALYSNTMITTIDELKKKSDESREKYEETAGEIENLNSELSTTRDRINELKAQGTLSIAEEAELKKLQLQNDELERQIQYKQKILALQAEQSATDARNFFNETDPTVVGISESTTKTEQTSTGRVTTVVPRKVETKDLNVLEQVDNKINKYNDLIDKMEKGVLSPSDQKTLDELTAEITTDIDTIQEKKEALYNTDGELINKSDSGLVKNINTLIDKWAVLNGVESDYGEILDSILSKSSKLGVDDTIDLAIKKQERANKKLAKKMENGVGFDFTKFMESETFTRLSEDTQTAIANYQAELVDARRKGSDVTKRKFGNIDLDNRQGIEWNTTNLEKYADELDDLGIKADDVANSISTVLGSSVEFDGLEIAFSPILQTENGSELLSEGTVSGYIYDLLKKVKQKKKKWTTEDLLELDNEGLIHDGKYIHGLIADIGETAKQTAEVMHYSDSVSMAWNNISDAVEESSFMFTESNIESFFPGIAQEAVEAGSTIQEVIKELNSSLGYKNYKEMKRQLVDSLSVDPSDTGLKEDWSRYLDTLSDQQIDVLYNIDEDTDTSGWSINDFKNYLEEIDGSEITIDATIDISGEKQRLENLATYLGESLSATGLSTKSTKDSEGNETLSGLQSIKDMYSELKGYDSSKLFETTANGIHLNREELRKLEQELEKENLKKVNQELYSATDSYNHAYQKLREIGDLYGKDDERYISQEKITNELNDQLETLRLQKAEYQALTSEYNKLVTAQNTTDEREGYENIGNEYDAIADLVARGWYGDEEVRAFVDLLTFKDVSTAGADEVLKRWNQLDDKIKGTKFTYKDFFTVDDSGNATSDGIFNMLDALDQLNDKWVTIDKNGVYSFDFDTEEAAKALNVSVSWLNKMEQAAIDAGFAVNMNDSAQAQKYLKDQIEETTNALKTMDGALLLDVDFETTDFDTEIKKIQEYRQTIDEAYKNKEISLEVHDKELEYANQNMLLLLEYKHQLEEPAYMKLDVSDVEKEYSGFLKLLQKYQKATERRDDLKLLGGSPDEIRAARKEASAYLDYLYESSAETKLAFGIDEKATKEEIKKMIDNNEISVPIALDETEALDKIVGATDSLQKVLNGDYRLSFEFTKDDDGNILGMIMNLQDQNGIRITFDAEETEGLKNLGEQINGLLKTFNEGNVDLDSGLVGNIIKAFNSLPDSVKEALNTTDSELQSHLNNLETSIRMGLELDSEDVDFILNFIGNLSPELLTHIGIDTTVLDKWLKKDHDTTGKVAYSPDASKVNAFERQDHTATGKIVYKPDISYLKSINFNRTATVTYRNSGIPLKQTGKNFASAFGTACAKGKWGVPKKTNALVGELGTELLIDPLEGTWETVGTNGAEFVDIPRNAIVFNHKQTEELLKNGHINSRGRALAYGTALANGKGGSRPSKKNNTTKRDGGKVKSSSSEKKSSKEVSDAAKKTSKAADKVSSSADKTESTAKTASEKLQDWLGKLFDWIEVKINRITGRIDNFIARAELATERGNFDNASKNYRKALNDTYNLMQIQSQAAKKYQTQANKVLDKAVALGVIDRSRANSIKSNVASGKMDIDSYSEKVREVISAYQEWAEKAKTAKDAIVDLQKNVDSYVSSLKQLRDTQRDAKIEEITNLTNIGTSGITTEFNTQVSNSQLGYSSSQAKKQNAAYAKETSSVSSDVKALGKTATTALNKDLKKATEAYKKVLKKIKTKIAKKTRITSSELAAVKKRNEVLYNRLVAFNLALDNLEVARMEQALNYAETSASIYQDIATKYSNKDTAVQKKIDIYQSKADNATGAYKKNDYLDKILAQYQTIEENNLKEINEYQGALDNASKIISQGRSKLVGDAYGGLSEAGKQSVMKAIETAKSAVKKGVAIPVSTITRLAELYQKGYVTYQFYAACVNYNNVLQLKAEAEAQAEIDKQAYIEQKATIGKQKFENIEQDYSNRMNTEVQNRLDIAEAEADLNEARSEDVQERNYTDRLAFIKEQQKIYQEEMDALEKLIKANIAEGLWSETSQEYLDAMQSLHEYDLALNNSLIAEEQLKDALRDDVYWRTFDKAHESAERLAKILSGISNLISEDMFFDHDGNLTEYGIVHIGELVEQYKNAQEEVKNFSNDIENLENLYEEGWYTQDEYEQKLNELQESLLNSASDLKGYIENIKDMYQEIDQKELDALNELIDKRKEALSAKKNYYDYDKTLRSSTKDLQELNAQLAALEGIDTAEAKRKRAELSAEIEEKETDLSDTIQDHAFDMLSNGLDELKQTLQDNFDEKWENLSLDLNQIQQLINDATELAAQNGTTISSALNELLKFYGINPVDTKIEGAFAKGTKGVPKDMTALTNERGNEIVVTKTGIITPLKRGDGVIPADLTERLYELALGKKMPGVEIPPIELQNTNNINVTQKYDSLIHIDGSADAATVQDLKNMTSDLLKKSYEYTSKQLYKGYLRSGGRRSA